MEDQLNSIRTEWHTLKEKWFHGEKIDPVFEGVVRDFCAFDDKMHAIQQKVGSFMRGVDQFATGMNVLCEGVSAGLANTSDHLIASDTCKLKEATNQIARADAPHSAIAKLRRDMQFNILTPVQNHIANNRNLKVSLDIRRRRLVELTSAKKKYDECVKKNLSQTDRRFLLARSNFESAKMTFNDVDRHVFEWLYILEEYRGDILDSTLQTLKYLQYEFFAASAHAISGSLPARMEFRPMVEMTPEHLEAQVEMELQESEEQGAEGAEGVADFSARLIDKKTKEEPQGEAPALPVDPLSLSSLLSQGFDEGPARRALRLHQNDTQAALDWLINGGTDDNPKRVNAPPDGVRMPTTVKRVQKLKAMRKAQQEKLRRERGESGAGDSSSKAADDGGDGSSDSSEEGDGRRHSDASAPATQAPAARAPVPNMMDDLLEPESAPAKESTMDLLSLDQEEEKPTDFSKSMERVPLPPQLVFDPSLCEKQPLSAAVAAGIAQPRGAAESPVGQALAAGTATAPQAPADMVQALASQMRISPQELLQAAQQLAASPPQAQQFASLARTTGPQGPPAPAPGQGSLDSMMLAATTQGGGGGGGGGPPAAAAARSPHGQAEQAASKDPLAQLGNLAMLTAPAATASAPAPAAPDPLEQLGNLAGLGGLTSQPAPPSSAAAAAATSPAAA